MRAKAAATIVIVLLMSMGGCALIVGDVDGTRGVDGGKADARVGSDSGIDAMAGWSAPVVLASSAENPAGVTVVSGKLYWVNENDSTIRSLGANGTIEPTDGGGAVAYTLVSPARELLGNGDHLFARVTKGSTVLIDTTTPDPEGGVPALYSDVSVTAIAVIDGYYFLGGSSDNHGCSGAGAGLQVNYGTSYPWSTYTCFGPSFPPLTALAGSQIDALFVGSSSAGPVYAQRGAAPGPGGPQEGGLIPLEQNATQAGIVSIAATGSAVYWATPDGNIVAAAASGGGVPTTLVTGQNNPAQMRIAGASLFWTSSGDSTRADGTVSTIPVGSGVPTSPVTPTVLASDQDTPFGLYVAQTGNLTTVYWSDRGTVTGAGSVMKVSQQP